MHKELRMSAFSVAIGGITDMAQMAGFGWY